MRYLDWIDDFTKQAQPFVTVVLFVIVLYWAWGRHMVWLGTCVALLMIALRSIHIKRRPPRRRHKASDPVPNTPYGDVVDGWLRDRQRCRV